MNKKVPAVLLTVIAIVIVSCLVVGALAFGALRLAGATIDPIPTKVVERPGFDGELAGRWRQRQGGFTGDEALLSSDAALTEKWPVGSVVELVLGADGRYRFTTVEASGSGALTTKSLTREEGLWERDELSLSLTATSGVSVKRVGGDRTSSVLEPSPLRRYQLKTRVMESAGTPGASPLVTEGLRLTGPCLRAPGECTWEFEPVE
ncbi:MAG: hypothetical protein Q8S33_23420 [Myxococcales bacterium]|nr:hypothetical protein [Myxococcales bacterium]